MLIATTALRGSSRFFVRPSQLTRRCFSSEKVPPPPPKKNSSQLMWQVGTAVTVIGAFVGVNKAISYGTKEEDDFGDMMDKPGA
jgi:hypothetical protein